MFPQAMSKSFAKRTGHSWPLIGRQSWRSPASMYKPVCSQLHLAVFCCIPWRNCKWNGAGWNNFRLRSWKMKSGQMWPMDFETGENRYSALRVTADELLDTAKRFVVGNLHGRMLGKIGGRRMQHPADAAVERNLAAADCVDRYASRVGRIFD